VHSTRRSHKSLTYKILIVFCNLLNPQNPSPHLYFKSLHQTNHQRTYPSKPTTKMKSLAPILAILAILPFLTLATAKPKNGYCTVHREGENHCGMPHPSSFH
jgi:hypothetical protein